MDADSLKSIIEKASHRRIGLTITDNSTSMLSLRQGADGDVNLRIHRMFLEAGADVIDEIADFVKHKNKHTPLIRKFIRNNSNELRPPPHRRTVVTHIGKYHNLKPVYDDLNQEYFNGNLALDITWGRRLRRKFCRRRRLGSYDNAKGLITIHRALDNPNVPLYFVQYVVYHEMLHGALGVNLKNGRRAIHGSDFMLRERLFRDFDRAVQFLKYKL